MTTDRNSEAVGYLCPTQPIAERAFSWTQINCWTQPLYTTPPASIPASEVQALVERITDEARMHFAVAPQSIFGRIKQRIADELAQLIQEAK